VTTYTVAVRTLCEVPANQRHLHWAQAKVYGAMLCQQFGLPTLTVSLVYFDIDKQAEAHPLLVCGRRQRVSDLLCSAARL
jgi:hypothetical protein